MSSMESEPDLSKQTPLSRHKCVACFKQYKKKEHLVEHMQISFHSVHQPRCAVCRKHCKSFESLREHLTGPLAKAKCWATFSKTGCGLCLKLFDDPASLHKHEGHCCLPAPASLGTVKVPCSEPHCNGENLNGGRTEAIAMDCEMVGGGSDGTLELCASVCLIDEDENIVFHSYVQPLLPVTDYRYEVTGLTEEHLRDAVPLKELQERISEILYNGETVSRVRLFGGKARLLVGHGLANDLDYLNMHHPDHLLRDTAKYRPLMKTNFVSHSLKYLTRTYLGYEIQTGQHNPYEDCVSAMRLYKRMRDLEHHKESFEASFIAQNITDELGSLPTKVLENLTPDELYHMSTSNYRCWCLDQSSDSNS